MKQYIVSEQQINNLYYRALHFGEDLLPADCSNIIGRYFRSNETRQAIGREQFAKIIIELMERCSFSCEMEEAMNVAEFLF